MKVWNKKQNLECPVETNRECNDIHHCIHRNIFSVGLVNDLLIYGDLDACNPLWYSVLYSSTLSPADKKKTVCEMESSEGAQVQQTRFQFTRFVPLCDRYGGYRKVQCGSLGECWCVDRYGNELPRTKTKGIPYCDPDG